MHDKIKLIIADDHPVFRSGMESAVKNMNLASKISQASNGEEVIKLLEHEFYDIVLMDIKMSPMDGIRATEIISLRHPKTKVIALSMHDDKVNILEVLEKGASGYLIKNADNEEIEEAIKDVMDGNQYFSKHVSRILYEQLNETRNSQSVPLKSVVLQKERFKEIIFLICHEFTNNEIGEALFLSSRTIEDYRKQILQLTGTRNAIGLVKYAMANKIIDDKELKVKFEKLFSGQTKPKEKNK